MAGMVDSSNRIFVVEHRHNAMQFDGYKDEAAVAEAMLYRMGVFSSKDVLERQREVYDLAKRVCLRIGEDDIEPGDQEEDEEDW